MSRYFFPALLIPLFFLGVGCSRAVPSSTAESQAAVEAVGPIEVTSLADGTYTLEAASSTIVWSAQKRVGAHHTGTVDPQTGAVVIEQGTVTGGTMEVNMYTIKDTDLTDVKENKKLVGQLKSDDFFAVATYPTATFALEQTKALVGNADATHEVTGTMTIKGIENEVTFPATFTMTDAGLQMTGAVTLDRTLWDVRYGSDAFFDNLGNELIEDEFTLTLDMVFTLSSTE